MKENLYLPAFLFDAGYRKGRHLLFMLVGAIITFNQVFLAYPDCQVFLGNRIYRIGFFYWAVYMGAIYFNYFYLAPKFLLRGKYVTYSIFLCAIILLLPTLSIAEEYWVRNHLGLPHRIADYTHPLILVDNLSTAVITGICFFGVSANMWFRKWSAAQERINRLEGENIQSELNKLKGQITPDFLSRTLRNASAWVETDPQKTSCTLMELGQLLRYQLYDCNREKILLKSEIGFLTKYMQLEQRNREDFRFQIHVEGNISNAFVSPMLFISLVQHAAIDSHQLDMSFRLQNDRLIFTCKPDRKMEPTGDLLSSVKKRVELQYPQKHALRIAPEKVELQLNISK